MVEFADPEGVNCFIAELAERHGGLFNLRTGLGHDGDWYFMAIACPDGATYKLMLPGRDLCRKEE